jgi:hypothetical protein
MILTQRAEKLRPRRPYRIENVTNVSSGVPKPQRKRQERAAAVDEAKIAMEIDIRSVRWPSRALPGTEAARNISERNFVIEEELAIHNCNETRSSRSIHLQVISKC